MDPYVLNIVWPNVVGFLEFPAALALRATCTEVRDCVNWFYSNGISLSTPRGCATNTVRTLRKRFPANRTWAFHKHIGDGSLAALKGSIKSLTLVDCSALTDTGLAHLHGIHTLKILSERRGATIMSKLTDAGIAHLTGIHTFSMSPYAQHVTDTGIAHLAGIHTLDFRFSRTITDASLAHLKGIHTLLAAGDAHFTNAGLASLAGIHTLSLCPINNHRDNMSITDAGIAHLRGIHTLTLDWTVNYRPWGMPEETPTPITWAGLSRLKGLQELTVGCDCPKRRTHSIFSWENQFTHMTPAERMAHYRGDHRLRV